MGTKYSLSRQSPSGKICLNDAVNTQQYIQLNEGASPPAIAAVLMNALQRTKMYGMSPLVATRIILNINNEQKAKLVSYHEWNSFNKGYSYVVSSNAYNAISVVVTLDNNKNVVFNGMLDKFYEWAKTQTGLDGIVKKVVQFKYLKGTRPGAVRTVRVEKVGRGDSGYPTIEGLDLESDDLQSAGYRKYVAEHIEGDITVLN